MVAGGGFGEGGATAYVGLLRDVMGYRRTKFVYLSLPSSSRNIAMPLESLGVRTLAWRYDGITMY